ncbi:MAG: c-type cytochrome [Mariprofundaceae bacterium]|nr:c-type cytochrome [Mariprofundaceae bacterium]
MKFLWTMVVILLGTTTYAQATDVETGRKIFKKTCAVCHNLTDKKKVGPGLKGVYGRSSVAEIGTLTEEKLHRWLKNPRGVKPRTRMPTYKVMADPVNRQAMIDFLQTL